MATLTPENSSYKVGLIIGSQRKPRCCDQIAHFVLDTIKRHLDGEQAAPGRRQIAFQVIDIAALNLPLSGEPGIPSQITDASGYEHEHTRAWSRTVAALDAFVFVTPQYNWGIPAALKNAIDHLFNEWKGKPAMVVTYGGHGGDKCAAAMQVVLAGGLRMKVPDSTANLAFPGRGVLVTAATGGDLGLDAASDKSTWAGERSTIIEVWKMMEKLF